MNVRGCLGLVALLHALAQRHDSRNIEGGGILSVSSMYFHQPTV